VRPISIPHPLGWGGRTQFDLLSKVKLRLANLFYMIFISRTCGITTIWHDFTLRC